MRRPLQDRVLAALASTDGELVAARGIFTVLGIARPTMSKRVCLSRSLAALSRRGLVEVFTPHETRVGSGYLYRAARKAMVDHIGAWREQQAENV